MDKTTAFTNVVVALIAAGLLRYGVEAIKTWRDARKLKSISPSPRDAATIATVDASLLVVARARDELEEDNLRLRQTLSEERKARKQERMDHEEDRTHWLREKQMLRQEIDTLERKLRGLLAEVEELRTRTQTA